MENEMSINDTQTGSTRRLFNTKRYGFPTTVLVIATFIAVYHSHFFEKVRPIDFYSVVAEGFITSIILYFIFKIQDGLECKVIYRLLTYGFGLLFIALWTDTLDELYDSPAIITTIFEDLFQLCGFVLIVAGLSLWLKLNTRVKLQLNDLANTDSLTGLLNRRAFSEILKLEHEKYLRYKEKFSLLIIDIDHFKSVNDVYGHSAGDETLKVFSDAVKTHLRKSDTLCRWGGEEFLILLPNSDEKSSQILAEKLRLEIEGLSIQYLKDRIKFTVCIGIASINKNDSSPENLIHRADIALFAAKDSGRNKVHLAK